MFVGLSGTAGDPHTSWVKAHPPSSVMTRALGRAWLRDLEETSEVGQTCETSWVYIGSILLPAAVDDDMVGLC